MKSTNEGVLLLVELKASACKFTKSNTPLCVFSNFLKLCRWYQIAQRISHVLTHVSVGDHHASNTVAMALRQTADLRKEEFSEAANILLRITYVDDYVDSVASVTDEKELIRNIDALLKVCRF